MRKTKQAATPYTSGPLDAMPNDPRLCIKGTENLFSVVKRTDAKDGGVIVQTLAENCDEPDAVLYAAAPDLLDACRHALLDWEAGDDISEDDLEVTAVQLREALTKAGAL